MRKQNPGGVIPSRYYYDTYDRMTRILREDADGDTFQCSWEYDHNDNVTRLVETINGEARTTSYTYDADQRVSAITTTGAGASYTYDGFGRVSGQTTKNGSSTVLTDTFTYRSPGTGLTSTQVQKLELAASNYNVTYTYAYDANGNITSVSDGTNTTTYAYDSLNQLTRENNQAAGKTWVWTYDSGGNITSKKEYEYTTGTVGTATDTISRAAYIRSVRIQRNTSILSEMRPNLGNVIKLVTLPRRVAPQENECIPQGMHFFCNKGMTSKRIGKSA